MESERFDAIARALVAVGTRRGWLRAVGGGLLAVGLGRRAVGQAVAGCRNHGKPCRKASQCCSGLCRRKKCRPVPGTDTCQGLDFCGAGVNTRCHGSPSCLCIKNTAGTSVCASYLYSMCATCTVDADCTAVTGAGSICVDNGPNCFCEAPNKICVPPCPI